MVALHPLSRVERFLVPVDGSEAGYGAVGAACEVARRSKARVHLLYVIVVPRALPLDAGMEAEARRGERVLERAEQIAEDHHVKVEGDLVQAREAGHAIVDEATELRADAIVLGLDYHRPYGRFELGPRAEYLLEHAPAEVWLIRYPPDSGHGEGAAGSR
ncbi:MAG: universal stress protein [Dehalococcoidia bacterium]|nr:universal stress protein [Dehalococcoidia bacterium]